MKNRFLILALSALSLTSCASYHPAITQPAVRQIRPGLTTEPDLLALFGPPDTRVGSYNGGIALAWFRSVPPGPASAFPVLGELSGGLHLDVQELDVIMNANGRVRSYSIFDSKGAVRTEKVRPSAGGPYAK